MVGIAGPGDPLANQETFETFRLIGEEFPQFHDSLACQVRRSKQWGEGAIRREEHKKESAVADSFFFGAGGTDLSFLRALRGRR